MTVTEPTQPEALDPAVIALLPEPGAWTEADYLWLTDQTNRLAELADGNIEVLPVPTERHQAILAYLYLLFHALMRQMNGVAYFAPLRLRIGQGRFREPDLLLVCSAADPRRGDAYWTGADLVVEIVSANDPERDYVTKRSDYAYAGIAEYWIVDPQHDVITVLRLEGASYVEHGTYRRGTTVRSALFPELEVAVDEVLAGQ